MIQRSSEPLVPASRTCSYYLVAKRRCCKQLVTRDSKYCVHHNGNVPYDCCACRFCRTIIPSHRVRKHSEKCPAHLRKLRTRTESFFRTNTNVPAKVKNVARAKPLDSKEIVELLNRVEEAFVACCSELESSVANIVQSDVGASAQQVAAFNVDSEQCQSIAEKLITFIPDIRLYQTDTTLVELCAGRGYLSSEVLRQLPLPRLVLVDRRPFRFKADRFLKRQCETHRLTVDLKDLDLYRSHVLEKSKVLVVGKHLCGEATDYALRCTVGSKSNSVGSDTPKLQGLYGLGLAPCCHHSCRWLTFINTPFLERLGISEVMFPCLARMSSWATLSESHGCKSSRSDKTHSSSLPDTKLQRHEKVVIGRKIKFILNTARVVWLRERGFDVHLDTYVDLKLTPENMLILARCL